MLDQYYFPVMVAAQLGIGVFSEPAQPPFTAPIPPPHFAGINPAWIRGAVLCQSLKCPLIHEGVLVVNQDFLRTRLTPASAERINNHGYHVLFHGDPPMV